MRCVWRTGSGSSNADGLWMWKTGCRGEGGMSSMNHITNKIVQVPDNHAIKIKMISQFNRRAMLMNSYNVRFYTG